MHGKNHKLARPYHGPYHVINVTQTNAEVQLIEHPSAASIFVALGRLCKCYPEQADDCWVGHKKRVYKIKTSKRRASDSAVHVDNSNL